jgi:hypothetical protein
MDMAAIERELAASGNLRSTSASELALFAKINGGSSQWKERRLALHVILTQQKPGKSWKR